MTKIRTYWNAFLDRMISGRDAFVSVWSAHVTVQLTVMLLSVLVGLGAGALAEALKFVMLWLWDTFVGGEGGLRFHWTLLLLPMAGMLSAMVFQRYILKQDLSCGTAQITRIVHDQNGDYKIPFMTSINSLIGCSLTVGLGSSAGSEGPTALSGAALGSSFGRVFKLDPAMLRAMVAIGAGAGIAAIFKAPVGGVLYVLEVLELPMSTLAVLSLVLSCTLASTTAYFISGTPFDMSLQANLPHNGAMGWIMLLGVFIGIYSLWYVGTKNRISKFLSNIKNPWIKVLLAGAGMSVCVFMVPALFGEGTHVIWNTVTGRFPSVFDQGVFAATETKGAMFYLTLLFIMAIKGVLVGAANNGGGVAGEMVPALFIGAVGGYLFGCGLNDLFRLDIPVWYMSLTGMGAMLGCSSHAPLMSVFILCEMTNTLNLMPAYIICALISYVIMKIFRPDSTWLNTGHDDLISIFRDFLHKESGPDSKNPSH